MNRRHWLGVAVGVGAAAVGAAIAWRRQAADEDPLWSLEFDQPDGGRLTMAGLRGRPLLLNFWATWCPPCVKEMPLLDAFHRQRQAAGWQVVGLAIDGPTPVREYLARLPIGFPIGLAGLGGTELSRRLGNAGGALPFTVVFDATGRPVARKLGAVGESDLADWGGRYAHPA